MADPRAYGGRLPTGKNMRQPTGYGAAPAMTTGVGFTTDVAIPERLVTQHGITGMKTGAQGPNRQIYDRSYYLNLLKQKNVELQTEINNLKGEVDTIQKENQQYVTCERQFDDLIKEVRLLEGELADYNLALDKQRSDTKAEDIMAILYHLQAQNERQRQALDEVFIQRKNKEVEINGIDDQIQDINLGFEERLNELDPESRSIYEQHREENTLLEQEIAKKRNILDEVSTRLAIADGRLREDPVTERAQVMRDEKTRLLAKKDELLLLTDEMNLPFPEARERLISRAKEDQASLKMTEQRILEIRKLIDSYQKQIKEIDAEMAHKESQAVDPGKYEILREKDKEYTDFIENFESIKSQELEQVGTLEKRIEEQLDAMSRKIRNMERLPTKEEADNIAGEKKFHENLVISEAETYEIAKKEVEERTLQLARMDNVEPNIEKNMNILKEKMEKMQEEMDTKYSKIDTLISSAEGDRARLKELRAYYQNHRDGLVQQVTYASIKIEGKKTQLAENEGYKNLLDLERKIAENESSLYGMRQFIENKKHETDYKGTQSECMALLEGINSELIKENLK